MIRRSKSWCNIWFQVQIFQLSNVSHVIAFSTEHLKFTSNTFKMVFIISYSPRVYICNPFCHLFWCGDVTMFTSCVTWPRPHGDLHADSPSNLPPIFHVSTSDGLTRVEPVRNIACMSTSVLDLHIQVIIMLIPQLSHLWRTFLFFHLACPCTSTYVVRIKLAKFMNKKTF